MLNTQSGGEKLLRFWVCESPQLVRIAYQTAGGAVEQSVASVLDPTRDTEWRPSVGRECPDAIAETVAEIAYEAIVDGYCGDPRFMGWDASEADAYAACDAAFMEAA